MYNIDMKKKDIPSPPVIEREPRGKWHVKWQGKLYGPWEFLAPNPELSPDRRHWAVLAGEGPEHLIILDGREYGPYDVAGVTFMPDSRCYALFRREGAFWIFLDGREIGPYRHDNLIRVGGALLADLEVDADGEKLKKRCVIAGRPLGRGKYVFFSPHSGASIEQAIEVINAVETGEGIATEHLYVGLKYASEGKKFEIVRQQHVPHGLKHYEKLTIKLEDGTQESYYFGITSFYGKFAPEIEEAIRS